MLVSFQGKVKHEEQVESGRIEKTLVYSKRILKMIYMASFSLKV